MRVFSLFGSLFLWCAIAATPLAAADLLNSTPAPAAVPTTSPFSGFEARFGGIAHSLLHNTEQSADINLEVLSPRFFQPSGNPFIDFVIRPRLTLGGNINTGGFRNQAYGGLTWTFDFNDRFAFELGWAALVHDGPNLPPPGNNELQLGCSLLFRESFAFTYRFADNWRVIASFDHGSNAGLCRRNVGINNAGLKIGYTF